MKWMVYCDSRGGAIKIGNSTTGKLFREASAEVRMMFSDNTHHLIGFGLFVDKAQTAQNGRGETPIVGFDSIVVMSTEDPVASAPIVTIERNALLNRVPLCDE
jgi:hypothetical protein